MDNKAPGDLQLLGGLLFRFRGPLLRGGMWLSGLFLGGVLLLTAVEAAFYPWARSLTGGPTLTGSWTGQLSPPAMSKHLVYFELSGGGRAGRCDQCRHIGGVARVCDGSGTIRLFDVSGDPENWRGTAFWLTTARTDNREGAGLQLGRVDGEWSGDTIRATATLLFYRVEGGAARATTGRSRGDKGEHAGPGVPLVLARGREKDFVAACSRLGSQGHNVGR